MAWNTHNEVNVLINNIMSMRNVGLVNFNYSNCSVLVSLITSFMLLL